MALPYLLSKHLNDFLIRSHLCICFRDCDIMLCHPCFDFMEIRDDNSAIKWLIIAINECLRDE